jgi:hypothetical protein
MTYLVWRQYRLQWAIALAILAGFAAVELIDGLHMAAQWHSLVATCAGTAASQAGPGPGPVCLGRNIVSVIGNDLRILSVMVPAILGMLLGAPLVAHEMEAGTTGFAWTQGITRTRWLAAKVGILLLSAAVCAGAVSALVTWWSGPENAQRADAFQVNYFDTQGITPIGYAVFAMALGITAGVLFRRTIPAIAVTLGGFIGLRLWFGDNVRPHLMTPVTTFTSLTSTWSPSGSFLGLGAGIVNGSGQVVSNGFGPVESTGTGATMVDGVPSTALPAACQRLIPSGPGQGGGGLATVHGGPNGGPVLSCMSNAGFRQFTTYQPASRYWAFQGIEAGIYVAVAAALLAVAFYVIRRRDA